MTQVFLLNLNIYPTAASRTTVTGTLSFLRASAICRLNTQSTNKKRMKWMSVRPLGVERGHFTDSVHSPGWVRLRFSHIDREAFLLSCSLFQHPQDDSGVRVSQDFLSERHLGTQGKVTESPKHCKYKGFIVRVPASELKNHWPSHSCVLLEDNNDIQFQTCSKVWKTAAVGDDFNPLNENQHEMHHSLICPRLL